MVSLHPPSHCGHCPIDQLVNVWVVLEPVREALFANPDEVLGGYELNEEEIAALKAIDAETMNYVDAVAVWTSGGKI